MQFEPLLDRLFSNPLSSATEARGRRLLLVASAGILIAVYSLEVKSTAWLDLEVPEGAPDVLSGALSVVVLYSLLAFIFYVWTDLKQWHTSQIVVHFRDSETSRRQFADSLSFLERSIRESSPDAGSWPILESHLQKIIAKSKGIFEQIEEVDAARHRLSALQWTRLCLFDIAVPVLLGVYAFVHLFPALWPFVQTLFK